MPGDDTRLSGTQEGRVGEDEDTCLPACLSTVTHPSDAIPGTSRTTMEARVVEGCGASGWAMDGTPGPTEEDGLGTP